MARIIAPVPAEIACPICGFRVQWSCHGTEDGDEGFGVCGHNPIASRVDGKRGEPVLHCPWQGTVIRKGVGVVLGATNEGATEQHRRNIAEMTKPKRKRLDWAARETWTLADGQPRPPSLCRTMHACDLKHECDGTIRDGEAYYERSGMRAHVKCVDVLLFGGSK